jgi:hypothetical protein
MPPGTAPDHNQALLDHIVRSKSVHLDIHTHDLASLHLMVFTKTNHQFTIMGETSAVVINDKYNNKEQKELNRSYSY